MKKNRFKQLTIFDDKNNILYENVVLLTHGGRTVDALMFDAVPEHLHLYGADWRDT